MADPNKVTAAVTCGRIRAHHPVDG